MWFRTEHVYIFCDLYADLSHWASVDRKLAMDQLAIA